MKLFSVILSFLFCLHSDGQVKSKNKARGMSAQIEAGIPTVSITNPDSSFAYYSGVGLQGRAFLPVLDTKYISFNLTGSAKYLDLTNRSNTSRQKEVANLIGGGAGANIMLWKLFAGVDYQLIYGRHYAIGAISRELNYSFSALQQYYGMQWEFGALMVGASYSTVKTTIPKQMTGLTQDSEFKESVYWVHFRYSSGFKLSELLKFLFKN